MFKKAIIHVCAAIIVAVSAIDTYWLSKNRLIMDEVEKNPIGVYLIQLDNGDVSLFIGLKFISTFCVLAVLYGLYYKFPKTMIYAVIGVAIFQVWLLFYLYSGPFSS